MSHVLANAQRLPRKNISETLYKKREYMLKKNYFEASKEATGCELKARNTPMKNSALSEWENARKRRLLVGASCKTRQERLRSNFFLFCEMFLFPSKQLFHIICFCFATDFCTFISSLLSIKGCMCMDLFY